MPKLDTFDLPSRFPSMPRWVIEIATAGIVVAVATGGRLLIDLWFDNVVIFPLVFPAIVVATILAGGRAGLMVLVASQMLAWYYLVPVRGSFILKAPSDVVSLILATVAQLLLLWVMTGYRHAGQQALRLAQAQARDLAQMAALLDRQEALNRQLVEQQTALQAARQNIEAIYQASGDGLALCEARFDAQGHVIEYQVLDVNLAHAELTGATREQMLTMPVSTIDPPIDPRWFDTAEKVLRTGLMHDFDIRSRANGRWLNIRVSRVSDVLFQQTFIDVSDRYALEEQRRTLMKEMSHRVMNNFQMVASFLHIQASAVDAVAREHLKTAERRVQVLANLHSLLAYTESESDIDAGAYVKELCGYLSSTIERPDAVLLLCEADPLPLSTDTVLPLGFVIAELVTNSAKYAYPPPSSGIIRIAFAVQPDGWTLTVSDDGCGLGSGKPGKSGGLGTRLVDRFVRQIGATLTTLSENGVQHEVRFRTPNAG
jgi:two-component sensor histidine kinase